MTTMTQSGEPNPLPSAVVGASQETHAPGRRPYLKGQSIAVIGAGVTGLAAARTLATEGVDPKLITVFEKNAEPGGKVETIQVDDRDYELGAAVIVPGRHKVIEALARMHGLTTRRLGKGQQLDVLTGKPTPERTFLENVRLIFLIVRYAALYYRRFRGFLSPLGYCDIPLELKRTWPQFVKKQRLEGMDQAVAAVVGGSGYLRPDDPPQAAQIARLLRVSSILGLIVKGVRAFNAGGFQELLRRETTALQGLGVRFEFGGTVTEIARGDRTILIIDGEQREFDHVFYTADLSYLGHLLAGASPSELRLFGRVSSYDYRCYILRADGLPNESRSYAAGIVPNMFQGVSERPVLIVKPYADTRIYLVYAYGEDTSTDASIAAAISAELARFGGAVGEVVRAKRWSYFPHVRDDLEGFFRAVMDLQGVGGLWVAGEATSLGLSVDAYEQGRDFARLFLRSP